MNERNERRRIILAVTETSPLPALWRVAKEHIENPHDEILTFMLQDDRWQRAASLSFTHEVSRVSGRYEKFTRWRATQIDNEAAARLAGQFRTLADEVKRQIAFEALPEHKIAEMLTQLNVTTDVLIASAELKHRPVYTTLVELRCQLLFVDSEEESEE